MIAIVGVIYGYVVENFYADFKPDLLKEKYPQLSDKITLWDFTFWDNKIPYD